MLHKKRLLINGLAISFWFYA